MPQARTICTGDAIEVNIEGSKENLVWFAILLHNSCMRPNRTKWHRSRKESKALLAILVQAIQSLIVISCEERPIACDFHVSLEPCGSTTRWLGQEAVCSVMLVGHAVCMVSLEGSSSTCQLFAGRGI